MLARMFAPEAFEAMENDIDKIVDSAKPCWYKINLSKAERRGKTPEEQNEMRKAKWKATQGGSDADKG